MTPEAAHEMGKRAAAEHLQEAMGPVFNGTIAGIAQDLEDAAFENVPAWLSPAEKAATVAHFLRGSAAHFGEMMREIEAHAAALEATR